MENLIDAQHGPVALLAGLLIVFALHLILKLGEFVYALFEKRSELKEKNIDNLIHMISGVTDTLLRVESRLSGLEGQVKAYSDNAVKHEVNTRRIFSALKRLSGKNWPAVRKHILEDEV